MTYSVAKPFAALTALNAVADGAIQLDQRVADVWPEYAAAGKAATTVRQVLSHSAGLPCFPESAASIEYDDRETLVAMLAAAPPEHEPGTAVAEHALTYGHLCDEIVRLGGRQQRLVVVRRVLRRGVRHPRPRLPRRGGAVWQALEQG